MALGALVLLVGQGVVLALGGGLSLVTWVLAGAAIATIWVNGVATLARAFHQPTRPPADFNRMGFWSQLTAVLGLLVLFGFAFLLSGDWYGAPMLAVGVPGIALVLRHLLKPVDPGADGGP